MTIVTASMPLSGNNVANSSCGRCDGLKRILSVSCDSSLLSSREYLLRSRGLQVTSALCVPEALQLCANGEFSLLVVGHTIPEKPKCELINKFREGCRAPVLVLHTSFEAPWKDADYTFDVHKGPSQLVEYVAELLANDRASAATCGPCLP